MYIWYTRFYQIGSLDAKKIGKLRGVELLTDKDYEIIKKNNNPKYIAKKYRVSSYIHLVLFITVQAILWVVGTESLAEIKMYLSDFSWLGNGNAKGSPYPNDAAYLGNCIYC